MVTYLTNHKKTTAKYLANKFEVSTRTIYRDLDVLSRAGIPVFTEKGRFGGIALLDGYVLDKSLFLLQEQKQLLSHLSSLSALGTPDTEKIIDKLEALFGKTESWLEVDFTPWGGGEQTKDLFRLLKECILQRNSITFDYAGQENTCTRSVEPYKIIFRGQDWYLYGFCQLREDFRFFKLKRMSNPCKNHDLFIAKPMPSQPLFAPQESISIVLLVSAKNAFRAYDDFLPEQVTLQSDGSFIVQFSAPAGDWLVGYILSFGSGVQVLEPIFLREQVIEQAKEIAHLPMP